MDKIRIQIAGKEYEVELAETPTEQEHGLQGKTELDPDKGMLFVFNEDDSRSFWMKDTTIPLDVIFIDEELNVNDVYKGEPGSEEMLNGVCSYVLELNQNSGVQIGDELEFHPTDKSKMMVLNSEGQIQMELEGGERIMSRPHTKTLIRFSKKAATTNKDNDYKAVGKRMFKFLQVQSDTPAEYVKNKDNDNDNDVEDNSDNDNEV